ncbi:MAG: hypothetical protein CMJ51_05170 [Planctomycetaceae bacterium]|nr:hypothetical protein [Planctomycetaceae bacterium]
MPRRRLLPLLAVSVALIGALILFAPGCGGTIPNRDPSGDPFPPVEGRDLEDRPVELPGEVAGAPAILMVGYVQETQFDIDRWTLGLLQSGTTIRLMEIPAVGGWFPATFLQSTIDDGMRSGIPAEDWASVVTLYGDDADRVQAFTGTERPRNARILLLDEDGRVRWFWDQGFSPSRLLEMLERAGIDRLKD